jgi:hypothetical protein
MADRFEPSFNNVQLVQWNANYRLELVVDSKNESTTSGVGHGRKFVCHAVAMGLCDLVSSESQVFEFE